MANITQKQKKRLNSLRLKIESNVNIPFADVERIMYSEGELARQATDLKSRVKGGPVRTYFVEPYAYTKGKKIDT